MKAVIMLLIMIELHIFADYHLQGILANMKQKRWWSEIKANDPKVTYGLSDYKVAMLFHCIEWSLFICAPMILCVWDRICGEFTWTGLRLLAALILLISANTCFHYIADDMKANYKTMTLLGDQAFHAVQIFLSWLIWTMTCGW